MRNLASSINIFLKNNFIELIAIFFISFFIFSNDILLSLVNLPKDFLPFLGDYRREHLLGHGFLTNPLLNFGAYSGSLGDYHPGPFPYNYPLAISWFLHEKFPQLGLYPFYTLNLILFFLKTISLILTSFIIYKMFKKIGLYLFTLIMILSINYSVNRDYFLSINSSLNPGSVQFLSIAVSFLFISTIFYKDKKYLLLLIFFSGLLTQNHISSFIFTFILLIYSLSKYIKNYFKKVNYYIYFFLSCIPWLQTLIRLIIEYKSIFEINNYVSKNKIGNQLLNFGSLVEQTPFYSIIGKYNPYPYDNLPILSHIYLIFIILLPFLIFNLIKFYIHLSRNSLLIGKFLILLFTFDIIINLVISKEPQQRNHLAGYIYLFVFLILLRLILYIKNNSNQNIIVFSLIIISTLSYNYSNELKTTQYDKIQKNNLISKSVKDELASKPIKLAQFDYYNLINSAYLDLVYELLTYNVDICIIKPELSKLKENYSDNFIKTITQNLVFVKHLYCNSTQLSEPERRSIYLLEDASSSLPNNLYKAELLTRIPNYINRKCVLEYYHAIGSSSIYNNRCRYTNDRKATGKSFDLRPAIDLSLYLERDEFDYDLLAHQKNVLESSFLSADNNLNNNSKLLVNVDKHTSSIVELYKYLNIVNYKLSNNYPEKLSSKLLINDALLQNSKLYFDAYSHLEFIPHGGEDVNTADNLTLGTYRFAFKSKFFPTSELNKGLSGKNKLFYCDIRVNLIKGILINDLPTCKNNNSKLSIGELNNIIREKLILSYINYLLYDNEKIPIRVPSNKDLTDIFQSLIYKNIYYTSFVNVKLVKFSDQESEKNRLYFLNKKSYRQSYYNFYDKHKIASFEVELDVTADNYNNISYKCTVEFSQPWYYMLPNYLSGRVINCKNI